MLTLPNFAAEKLLATMLGAVGCFRPSMASAAIVVAPRAAMRRRPRPLRAAVAPPSRAAKLSMTA